MANMLFLSACNWFGFMNEKYGVSEWTVIINQERRCCLSGGSRSPGRPAPASVSAVNDLPPLLAPFTLEVHRMLEFAACGGDVGQHDKLTFVYDAHGLHLLNHTINQVWRLREVTHRGP